MAVDLHSIYEQGFDVKKLGPSQKKEFSRNRLTTFSPALAIILHFITLGIFTWIYYGIQHGRLPRVHPGDFGAGKAIGFSFIPFFNIYWMFIFWLRLVDRVNFQAKLRNKQPRIEKGLMLATLIVGLIPYVGAFSFLILYPVCIGIIQSAINELARS
ncbi:hypothetical protein KY325_00985 [Candidatus Woesearchaeota archaeon]|nr:hypothetical protein [Candidatus Woesearchaeota archaeon]MBW3017713.1 hypothetical protein [Candidatus Woesearchaeota archaeon]